MIEKKNIEAEGSIYKRVIETLILERINCIRRLYFNVHWDDQNK